MAVFEKISPIILFSYFILLGLILTTFPQKSVEKVDWSKPIKECWSYNSKEGEIALLASDNKNIFIKSGLKIVALNQNGKTIWQTEIPNRVKNASLIGSMLVLTVQTDTGKHNILQLDKVTGLVNSIKDLPNHENNTSSKVLLKSNFPIPLSISSNPSIEANTNGKYYFEFNYKDNLKIVGTKSKTVAILDRKTNKFKNQINSSGLPIRGLVNYDSDTLLIGTDGGFVKSFKLPTLTQNWSVKLGGGVQSIYKLKDAYLVNSKDNFQYLLESNSGNLIWRERLSGRVLDTIIKNNYSFNLVVGDERISILELKEGKIVNYLVTSKKDDFIKSMKVIDEKLFLIYSNSLFVYSGKCKRAG